MKILVIVAIIIAMGVIILLSNTELKSESYAYEGENKNGRVILRYEQNAYELIFYPCIYIGDQHINNDSYTFNFYDSQNKIVLNTALTVFTKTINEKIETKLIGIKIPDKNIVRVSIETKNALYSIDLSRVERKIQK